MKKQFMLYGYSSNTDGTYFLNNRIFTQNVDFRTEEHYRYYLESGFNVLMLEGNDPYYGETWETSQTKKNMDAACKAGIKQIIIYDKRIFDCSAVRGGIVGEGKRFKTNGELEDFIRFCVKDYKKHPAFIGIMLVDEPRWFQIPSVAAVIRAVKKVDPEIYIQCNILPYYPGHGELFVENYDGVNESEAYRKYVENYLDETGADHLMYDSYPMRLEPKDGYFIRREHLLGLQIAAEEVKKRNLTFNFVCQTQAFYAHDKIVYRAPNEAEMRWQVNCVLAFGIKSIAYFTYWRKQRNSELEYFVDGTSFMTQDGRKTPLYFAMQKIHGELSKISDYLLDCEYETSSYYTDLKNTESHLEPMIKNDLSEYIEISGDGKTSVVITVLCHKPTGDKVICIFNANDPRGNYGGISELSVKTNALKIKNTFSLRYPHGNELKDGKLSLASGDGIFIIAK